MGLKPFEFKYEKCIDQYFCVYSAGEADFEPFFIFIYFKFSSVRYGRKNVTLCAFSGLDDFVNSLWLCEQSRSHLS